MELEEDQEQHKITQNLKIILFFYIQMQSCTYINQALQLHLQKRGLWSVKQCKASTGHRKLTMNMNSFQKAVAIM